MKKEIFDPAFIKKTKEELSKKAYRKTKWKLPGVIKLKPGEEERVYTTEEIIKEVTDLTKVGRYFLQAMKGTGEWGKEKKTSKRTRAKRK